ncbi:hypothetical protein SN15_01745 [Stenotrophomonas maltophilia]|nr:hypothetical protein SN15_01745 [Stenotrophomonas maltophilia]
MISEKDILPAADLPQRPAGRFDTVIGVARDSDTLANFALKDLPTSDATQQQLDLLVAGQQTSAIYADTLVDLQASPGTFVGQGAFVANGAGAGQYRWTGSAWQFLREDMLSQKADRSEALISSGNVLPVAVTRGEASNGGVLIYGSGGRVTGFTIPEGQRGGNTYFAGDFPASHLRGQRIRVVQKFNATAGFLGVPLGLNPAIQVQARAGSTVTTVTPVSFTNTQLGTVLTQTGVFDVPSNADYVGLVALLFNGQPATSNQTITVFSITYTPGVPVAGESANDSALTLRLNPMQKAIQDNAALVEASTITSGALIGEANPRGQAFNGGVINRFPDGRISGFTIPAGQQGGSTYFVGDIPVDEVRGQRIRITQVLTATAGFIGVMSVNPALGAQWRKGGTVNTLTPISKTTQQVGTKITQVCVVDVPIDADWVGVGIQLYNSAVAPSNQTVEVSELSFTLASSEPGETLADSTLRVRINRAIRQAMPDNAAGEYQATVTVKPSGGDFNHPKLALDAILDASPERKYRVAIYPGLYGGYAEWHLKDWVDLVGIGRREEIIISFENPDSASAATIRNTSVFWAARRSNIKNLTVEIKNGRYAIHAESDGQRPGNEFGIYNCIIRHRGNASAANNDWAAGSQYAVGSGNSPGERYILRGSHFEGPGGGFSYHTPGFGMPVGATYVDATVVDAEGCSFRSTTPGNASLAIKPIRPGAGDWCRLVGNTFDGPVLYATNEWVSPDTTMNRAQVHVFGHANTGMDFVTNVTGPVAGYTPAFT